MPRILDPKLTGNAAEEDWCSIFAKTVTSFRDIISPETPTADAIIPSSLRIAGPLFEGVPLSDAGKRFRFPLQNLESRFRSIILDAMFDSQHDQRLNCEQNLRGLDQVFDGTRQEVP
jgi:hypothetical protein